MLICFDHSFKSSYEILSDSLNNVLVIDINLIWQVLISKTVVAPEPEPLLMADFGSASGHGGMEDHGSRHVPGSSDSEPDYSYNMHKYPQVPHRSDDSIADMDDASGSGDSDNDWHDTRFPDQNNNRDNHHHGKIHNYLVTTLTMSYELHSDQNVDLNSKQIESNRRERQRHDLNSIIRGKKWRAVRVI